MIRVLEPAIIAPMARACGIAACFFALMIAALIGGAAAMEHVAGCLLYTSDAADE